MIRDTSAQDQVLQPAAKPLKKWAGWAAALAALAMLAWAAPSLRQQLGATDSFKRERLTLATVEQGTLIRDVAGEGKVVAAVSPTLYAANAGTVSLAVQAGDSVKKGQVLLTLASPDLQAKLAQERSNADGLQSESLRAEAAVRQSQAQAQSALDTAAIAYKSAQNDLARQAQAFAAGATAKSQVDQASDALARAEVALKQAQSLQGLQLDATRFELQAKRQAFERQQLVVKDLERQLDELQLRSPVDGQVGQLFVSERMSVAKDGKLLSVIDLSALEVQMQVAESFARELQAGMPGEITGNGKQWAGKVSSISPEVVNNEVAARLRFDGALPEQLRQNQRLSVRVLLDRREGVLTVARGSFIEEGGGHSAYVLQDGQAVKRAIRLGAQSLSKVEVLEGLKPGEQVVVSGADAFRGAERVTITN
ncbi:efflux transporter periplasmic adaptor subunit [Paucibacter sp. KBW04]|uniref:efflux RND transporter periplasmic adaptor subunit n=1 Tax=Paucibacter sp. KBW04 TaxID=2153361 RepID=UPI000F58AC49|nr:efflux RND transporter periplasmic adaptor subunit [Paucibacter sp. KBW04]RQO63644.1 efflux transporter periplasmic adaptor subunit [Paucibacter sp. KBW04]